MNFIKRNIKLFVGILIGMLISGGVVFAATLIDSSNVTYSPSDDNWNVSDVKSALDDIYSVLYPDCDLESGTTWTFNYTGNTQTFPVPCTGNYKLEVWGASGGSVGSYSGGKGGYAYGNARLEKNTSIYVYVGEKGGNASSTYGSSNTPPPASFNGGGQGGAKYSDNFCGASGGGATHIGKTDNLLKDIDISNLYIVAGAGGGGAQGGNGGVGGGLEGANGSYSGTLGGTQNSGYAFGQGGAGRSGSSSTVAYGCGGGGSGYYGGQGANYYGSYHTCSGGAGGSSYIGGVTNGGTSNGNESMPSTSGSGSMTGNNSHGFARITYLAN